MKESDSLRLPPEGSSNIENVLVQHNSYIEALSRARIPHSIFHPEVVDMEIDELAQKVRIKLWQILQRRKIYNLKAYIRAIVATEAVDMMRRHRSAIAFSLDEDEIRYIDEMLGILHKDLLDPAYQYIQHETAASYLNLIIDGISNLPPRQLQAMLCSLKEWLDDIIPLADACKAHGIDIEEADWPEEKRDKQRLRASLVVARKKLRVLLDRQIFDNERSGD